MFSNKLFILYQIKQFLFRESFMILEMFSD